MPPLNSLLNITLQYSSPAEVLRETDITSKYPVLGSGNGRLVINKEDADTVYKIGVGSDGIKQNYFEQLVWSLLKQRATVSKASQIAAPVISSSLAEQVIEMTSVTVVEESIGTGLRELDIKSKFRDYGFVVDDIGVGEYQNNEVAFDYGRVDKIYEKDWE